MTLEIAMAFDATGVVERRRRPSTGPWNVLRVRNGAGATARPCRCGHGKAAHDHFRPGNDCGLCGRGTCARYRAAAD